MVKSTLQTPVKEKCSPSTTEEQSSNEKSEYSTYDIDYIEKVTDLSNELTAELRAKFINFHDLHINKFGDPILLVECNKELYDRIVDWMRGHMSIKCALTSHQLVIHELPISAAHEAASRCITAERTSYNMSTGNGLHYPLKARGSADYILYRDDDEEVVQPDEQYCVHKRACPNLVVEVGVIQTLPSLHNRAVRYLTMSDNILLVVIIKIFHRDSENGPAMLALLYQRNLHQRAVITSDQIHPTSAVSFGLSSLNIAEIEMLEYITGFPRTNLRGFLEDGYDSPCTMGNMSLYELVIPVSYLLNEDNYGVINRQWLGCGDWRIDLHHLQTEILEALE